MKAEIHPDYEEVKVRCACGAEWTTGSTMGHDIQTDICSNCHPFYTGRQKLLDAAGRVEKFNRKFGGDYFKKRKKK
jgi:large subunit ribosomal protein L31